MDNQNLKSDQYYLQVLKEGEAVAWPVPEEELVVGSQTLEGGLVQYWAYPKDSGRQADSLPHAQLLAAQTQIPKSVILIDKIAEDLLELVLVKAGIAYARTESSLQNLEDNLTSILEFAKIKFNMVVEDFMTTSRVDPETEKKLDEISSDDQLESVKSEETKDRHPELDSGSEIPKQVRHDEQAEIASRPDDDRNASQSDTGEPAPTENADSFQNLAPTGQSSQTTFRRESAFDLPSSQDRGSKLPTVILFLILVGILGTAGYFLKDKLLSKFKTTPAPSSQNLATSTPTPTPTPLPKSIERSKLSVRVLNGTTKTGAAAALADKLKALGWRILTVDNASSSATPQSLVRVKKDAEVKIGSTMINDLSSDLNATASADLKASDAADVEVVIGKK